MSVKKYATLFLITLLFASCKTTDKVAYFQDIKAEQFGAFDNNSATYEMKIAPDDELSILVSSIDPLSVAAFTLPLVSFQPKEETTVAATAFIQS